jgi:hypothetical protein
VASVSEPTGEVNVIISSGIDACVGEAVFVGGVAVSVDVEEEHDTKIIEAIMRIDGIILVIFIEYSL